MANPYLARAMQNARQYSGNPYLARGGNPYLTTGQPSVVDQQLAPYVAQAAQAEDQKRSLLTPIQAIFDLLQRGQYMTANMAAAAQLGKPILPAAVAGLTGKEKGDWKQVLFGGQTPEGQVQGFIPWSPTTKAGQITQDALGFLANVILDPTTYIGVGPTRAATAASKKYADDVVQLALKKLGGNAAQEAPKFLKGFEPQKLAKIVADSGASSKAAKSYLAKYGGNDIAQVMSRTYKDALKTGKRLAPEQLVSNISAQAGDSTVGGLGDLLNPARYAGAGERSASFLGKEFGASVRYPAHIQAIDKAVETLKASPIGGAFTKAAWAVAGPDSMIGKVKEMFGVRNPYQQMVRSIERDIQDNVSFNVAKNVDSIKQVTRSLDPNTLTAVRNAMEASQGDPTRWKMVLGNTLKGDKLKQATDAVGQLNTLTQGWLQELQQGVDEKILGSIGDIQNYLPIRHSGGDFYKKVGTLRGTKAPGFTQHRTLGTQGNIEAEIKKMMTFMGVDRQTATSMVDQGLGTSLERDLEGMLIGRAIAQSKAVSRIDLIRKFRDMGVNLNDLALQDKTLGSYLTRSNAMIQNLGLKAVDDPSLHGYFFDRTVADVLQRAVSITASDDTLKNAGKMLDQFTTWIKGWLTMSPGFHIRNAESNAFTGFMKFGPQWFDPRTAFESTVATLSGLYGKEKLASAMSKIGVSAQQIQDVLSRVYNGKTLEDLSTYAAQKGVISRATMGFDLPQTVEQFRNKFNNFNPFSSENAMSKASHALGNVVESTPRFQMFLMDWKDVGAKTSPEVALDYAKNEAKKWFMDYGDLTGFERKVMKKVVPFYTWIRKNLANQVYMMIHMPEMYSMIPKAQQMLTGDSNISQNDLPDWMKQSNYLPLAPEYIPEALKGRVMTLWPNMPYGDLNQIPVGFEMSSAGVPVPVMQSPWDTLSTILSQAHPSIKTLVEIVPKDPYDIFFRSNMGQTKVAPGILNLLTKAKPALLFLDGMMRTLGFKDGLKWGTDSKGRLTMDSRFATVLDENIPLLNQLQRWMEAPEELFPVIQDIKQTQLGAVDSKQGLAKLLDALSFHAGIKLSAVDLPQQMQREMENIMQQAEQARLADRKKLPGYVTRSAQYWNARNARVRRVVGGQYGS